MDGSLVSLGLLCSVFLFYRAQGSHDVSLHTTIDAWAARVVQAGFSFHAIPDARLIYPKDGASASYYYANREPIRCYYGFIEENIGPTLTCCERFGFSAEPSFLAG